MVIGDPIIGGEEPYKEEEVEAPYVEGGEPKAALPFEPNGELATK